MQIKLGYGAEYILNSITDDDMMDLIQEGELEKFCNILSIDMHHVENTSSKYVA